MIDDEDFDINAALGNEDFGSDEAPAAPTAPTEATPETNLSQEAVPAETEVLDTPVSTDAQPDTQPEIPVDPQPGNAGEAKKSHSVYQDLKAERSKRQAAQSELEQMRSQMQTLNGQMQQYQHYLQTQHQQTQPQTPQPDIFEDPDGFVQQVQSQVNQAAQGSQLSVSRLMAVKEHGQDIVEAAINAAGNANLDQHFAEQLDPIGEAVAWHKNQQFAQEIGNDPQAYQENLKAQLMQQAREDVLAEMKQGANGGVKAADIPPSLASKPAASNAPNVVESDEDFFRKDMS